LECITSRENPKIKDAVKLARSRHARYDAGLFVVEGVRLCMDAVKSNVIINTAFFTISMAEDHNEEVTIISDASKESFEVSCEVMDKLSDTSSPQGVFCVCTIPKPLLFTEEITNGKFLFLDDIKDPANLGAIARTGEALGISGLILSEECCDIYNTKALRASMGSFFRIPCAKVSNSVQCLKSLKDKGFIVYGAVINNPDEKITDLNLQNDIVMVIGNEAVGISEEVREQCTKTVFIPMKGRAESLNAGAAAAILIWEMLRGDIL